MEIISLVQNPNLYDGDLSRVKDQIMRAVKNKISKLENDYNITISFPKNICNINDNNRQQLPSFVSRINPNSIEMLVPITSIISESTPESAMENMYRCMKIVISIKKDLQEYSSGAKTKEQVDTTFFTWNDKTKTTSSPKYEIDEMYEKKFGSKHLLKKLLEDYSETEYLLPL